MPALAPGLARKAKKILETKTEDPEVLSSLGVLSTFYAANSASDRRRLRSTIERKGLDVTSELLEGAEAILGCLDAVESDLGGLSRSCEKIKEALASHKESAGGFLALAERFSVDLKANDRKQEVVGNFLKKYQLSLKEVQIIQEGEPGDPFFETLGRIRSIHGNCKELLRTQHQRAGLELMDTMAVYQETAYERLSRWVQGRCRGLADADADEIDPSLKRGIQALVDRPMLYQYCVDELASARHNALFHRFISALTRGHRPIELHADDPKRYVNDMLAWVHQALVSEKEMADTLFGGSLRSATQDEVRDTLEESQMPSLEDLMDKIFASVCHQLKVRVEQVLIASPPVLLSFQLSQLLKFYSETIIGLVGGDVSLVGVLQSCRGMASRTFQEQLRAKGEKLLRNPPVIGRQLSPPQEVSEAMGLLLEIIAAHDSAIEATQERYESSEAHMTITAMVDPLIEACNQSSEALALDAPTRLDGAAKMDPSARETFLINCLESMLRPLQGHRSADLKCTDLSKQIEAHLSNLVDMEHKRLLEKCGMYDVQARVREYLVHGSGSDGIMCSDSALPLDRISQSMQSFFSLISEPDALPEFQNIRNLQYRGKAESRLSQVLLEAYTVVYDAVGNPANGYEALGGTSKIRHTPEQVKTILCV